MIPKSCFQNQQKCFQNANQSRKHKKQRLINNYYQKKIILKTFKSQRWPRTSTRTGEVEIIRRIKAKSMPRRKEGSGHRRHRFRGPRIESCRVHVSVTVVKLVRGRRRRGVRSALPKRTEPEELHFGVRLLPVGDSHNDRREKQVASERLDIGDLNGLSLTSFKLGGFEMFLKV